MAFDNLVPGWCNLLMCKMLVLMSCLAVLPTACAKPACPACERCAVCEVCRDEREIISEALDLEEAEWFVLKVIDGDTVVLRNERIERKDTVRLLRINTPERKKPGFEEAREALKYIVRGGRVKLAFEKPGVEKRDGFGRLTAYLMVGDLNANLEMVRLGWSRFYTKYGKGRLAKQFAAAETEAREAKRGLWGF